MISSGFMGLPWVHPYSTPPGSAAFLLPYHGFRLAALAYTRGYSYSKPYGLYKKFSNFISVGTAHPTENCPRYPAANISAHLIPDTCFLLSSVCL